MIFKKEILRILQGIDKTEIESGNGWWETSFGAEFGTSKLKEIEELLAQPEGITPREGLKEFKKGYAQAEQDLKREPLSDGVIADLWG